MHRWIIRWTGYHTPWIIFWLHEHIFHTFRRWRFIKNWGNSITLCFCLFLRVLLLTLCFWLFLSVMFPWGGRGGLLICAFFKLKTNKKRHSLIHPVGGSNLPPVRRVVLLLWRRKQTLELVGQRRPVKLQTLRVREGNEMRSNNRRMSR